MPSGRISVVEMPASEPAADAGNARDVVVAIEEARNAKLRRLTFVCGCLYVATAISHLLVLGLEAQQIMVPLALACALALFAAHAWLRRNRGAVNVAWIVCGLFYVLVVTHSLTRFLFAHAPADLMFVTGLMVALALLPSRPRQHDSAVVLYAIGWSAIIIAHGGIAEWRPFVPPLAVVLALSIVIRHVEHERSRHIEVMRWKDGRRQLALISSQQRYALAARGANDGLFEWSPDSGQLYLSPRWKMVLGYPERAVSDNMEAWLALVHPDDRADFQRAFDEHLAGHTPHLEIEYRIRRHDGSWAWMLCRGLCDRSNDGATLRLAGSQTDITARRAAVDRLAREAKHDALTGLPNRAFFSSELKSAFDAAVLGRNNYAVLYLDLDRFKLVNDSLGHHMGDRLLVAVAERLARFVRPGDVVARFGGDEFAVLLNHLTEIDDAGVVALRLHEALSEPFSVGELTLEVCASVGIAIHRPEYDSPDDLLRDADTAMYQAKRNGLDSCVFDGEMRLLASERLTLEQDLRNAVQRGELRLHYQPIVDLHSGAVVALEALVRWQHPTRGQLSPDSFLPVAEETGLMSALGSWVIDEGCRDLARWGPLAPTVAVSINCSAGQFAQLDFEERVLAALARSSVAPERLWLELTEQALMDHSPRTRARLKTLADAGVRLCIDDFGVGYSSLSYLQRYHFNVLKLDRSVVVGRHREQILQSMVMLAAGLGMDLVAEGVENSEQLALLRRHGCTLGQGFYFARPVPASEVMDLLRAGPTSAALLRAPQGLHVGTA